MRVANIFLKNIDRPINGVVKADQLDDQSVWQELDEFVVTQELDKHLRAFFDRYCEAIDNPTDPGIAGKIGIWISGFFGSGKSHFIKVLSYLLDNEPHSYEGETRNAVEFFKDKIQDPMLFGDIQRAVDSDTDVILFNIDSKADASAGHDAILAVFLKVLNELQGYSGEFAHIAHMERHLDGQGKLAEFQAAYRAAAGADWLEERDAYQFKRDQVIAALSHALGQSEASCATWVDSADSDFALTVESFAKWVKAYLDERGPAHRLVFLADEVGQFIGQDTRLMLNLQTITEDLGTICKGRSWVVVTSQEDIDAVLGEMQASRANDFSKIQGRFKTRLSLSSANVDEVIQARLLTKVDEAVPMLEEVYAEKGDILRNQLTFRDIGTTFKQFQDAKDFVRNYPFAPYQFKLLQRIFESIRKAGATGLHLAQGERSLLDAFQSAGKAVSNREIGVLVPLYLFYPSIESFLDTSVKRTIDQAGENDSLEPLDIQLLQVLFLIRYVDEIKGNVDNLVTLCLDEIDADRLGLKHNIEAALLRLEKETLISRSGDNYFFLTNEERDVNREIKNVELSSGEEARLLGELIFDDVLSGRRKHRFKDNRMDFPFNRTCDFQPIGNRADGALMVSVVTPLADDYELFNDGKCIGTSGEEDGQVLVRLADNETLGRELRNQLKTDKYLRTHDDGALPPTARRIHRDLGAENRHRRAQLTTLLKDLLVEGSYFIAGQSYELKGAGPDAVVDGALDYLIRNTSSKMGLLAHLHENPLHEIQALLRSDDIAQQTLDVELPENNPKALEELRGYLDLSARTSRRIIMHEMINDRFAKRPYGWPPLEVVLLLTRLCVSSEIQFLMNGAAIPRDRLYELISTASKWRNIQVLQRVTARPEDVNRARQLGHDLFAELGPDSEDGIYAFLRTKLETWQSAMTGFKALADTGNYPGKKEIDAGLETIKNLLVQTESHQFLQRVLENDNDLRDLADNYPELDNFFGPQKPVWDKLRQAHERFTLNRMELERNEEAASALQRMYEILTADAPYGLIREADDLIRRVSDVNDALIATGRAAALQAIDHQIELVQQDLSSARIDPTSQGDYLVALQQIRERTGSQDSLAHLSQAETAAVSLKDTVATRIREFVASQAATQPGGTNDRPKVKQTQVIRPADLVAQDYIETPEGAQKLLDALKKELDDALSQDQRVEIR